MNAENTLCIINMLRNKGVATVRTPAGIVFMGANRLSPMERRSLSRFSQIDLEAALKWQKA